MRIERTHHHASRYVYDTGMCSYANGFAQLDTGQDASYFGTWVNPTTRTIVCYCEGDVSVTVCDDDGELASELRRIDQWNVEQGWGPARIDPGVGQTAAAMTAAFTAIGVADLLHGAATP